MTSDFDLADPAALAAVQLRRRLRALAAGQTEAFDLLYYQFGAGSALGGHDRPRRQPPALSRGPAGRRCLDPWRACGA